MESTLTEGVTTTVKGATGCSVMRLESTLTEGVTTTRNKGQGSIRMKLESTLTEGVTTTLPAVMHPTICVGEHPD